MMETIEIARGTHGEKVAVDGFMVGAALAVTQALFLPSDGSPWWRVTHVPTGYAIGEPYISKADAERIALKLLEVADAFGFAWSDLKTVKQASALPKETIKAINAAAGDPDEIE